MNNSTSLGWLSGLVFVGLLMPASSAWAEDDASDGDDVVHDTIEERETLANLALEHGVSVEKLQEWNNLELGEAQPGMRLIVKSDEKVEEEEDDEWRPVVHRIERGDTLSEIADKYNVKVSQIKKWNKSMNPRRLQLGERVRLYVPGATGKSVSYGAASNGALYNGVALKSSLGLDVRNVSHAYGTRRVVNLLKAAAADVKARWPRTPALVVGHLSYKNGGPMSPHKSHQSGRDADLSYYHRGNVKLDHFRDLSADVFDARKNWHLFKTLIDSGKVEYIFVSYYLQKPLYEYARSIGYTKDQLEPILQYPRGKWDSAGLIRHSPGHDDHFHIRFTCGPKDRNCR